MAVVQPHDRPVSDELVREHARVWHAFARFITYAAITAAVILTLMAIFLL